MLSKIDKLIEILIKSFGDSTGIPSQISDLTPSELLIFGAIGVGFLTIALQMSFSMALAREQLPLKNLSRIVTYSKFNRELLNWVWLYLVSIVLVLLSTMCSDQPYLKVVLFNMSFLIGLIVTIWVIIIYIRSLVLPAIRLSIIARWSGL